MAQENRDEKSPGSLGPIPWRWALLPPPSLLRVLAVTILRTAYATGLF